MIKNRGKLITPISILNWTLATDNNGLLDFFLHLSYLFLIYSLKNWPLKYLMLLKSCWIMESIPRGMYLLCLFILKVCVMVGKIRCRHWQTLWTVLQILESLLKPAVCTMSYHSVPELLWLFTIKFWVNGTQNSGLVNFFRESRLQFVQISSINRQTLTQNICKLRPFFLRDIPLPTFSYFLFQRKQLIKMQKCVMLLWNKEIHR